MLKIGESNQEKNHLNLILKKTLLLMSVSCASFGSEGSIESTLKEQNDLPPSSELASSQEIPEKFENDPSMFDMRNNNEAFKFLEFFTQALNELNQLEEIVLDLLPQHPRNPTNVNNFPHKPTDWNLQNFVFNLPFYNEKGTRTESSWVDPSSEEALQSRLKAIDERKKKHEADLKYAGISKEDIAKIIDDQKTLKELKKKGYHPKTLEELNQTVLRDKRIKDIETKLETLKTTTLPKEKKEEIEKELEKQKALEEHKKTIYQEKRNQANHKEDSQANLNKPIINDVTRQALSKKLGEWFLKVSAAPASSILKTRIKTLSQWLNALSFLEDEEVSVMYLNHLLDCDPQSSEILETLHGWVFEDAKMRTQKLYEQLWPIYLDSKISAATLENVKLEAMREERKLRAIMENWSNFGRLQEDMANAIAVVVEPYLSDCFQKTGRKITDPIKDEITASFRQAISDISGDGHIPFQKSNPKMVEELSLAILKALEESQLLALQQARGQTSEKLTFDTISNQWSVKFEQQSYALKADHITIHVLPILRYFYDNITSRSSKWMLSNPISYSMSQAIDPLKNIVELQINEEIRKGWTVSECRTKKPSKTPKIFLGKPIQPTVRVKLKTKTDPQPAPGSDDLVGWENYFEASRYAYQKSQPPIKTWDIKRKTERRKFLKEIKQLRAPDYSDNGKETWPKLEATLESKNRVLTMHKLPEIQTNYLIERIINFFEEYMTIISRFQEGLEEGRDREFYLNEARTDLDFLKYPEKKYEKAKVRFLYGVHADDWKQISALMTNPLIFPKTEKEEDVTLKKLAFARDVKELVMISLIVDNLSALAIKNDFNYDNLSPDVFRGYYKKLESFLSHYKNLQVSLTDGNYQSIGDVSLQFESEDVIANSNLNLVDSPSTWAHRSHYTYMWNSIIIGFAQLFAKQLGAIFKMFDESMFDRLKEYYLPMLQRFDQTKDYKIIMPQSTGNPPTTESCSTSSTAPLESESTRDVSSDSSTTQPSNLPQDDVVTQDTVDSTTSEQALHSTSREHLSSNLSEGTNNSHNSQANMPLQSSTGSKLNMEDFEMVSNEPTMSEKDLISQNEEPLSVSANGFDSSSRSFEPETSPRKETAMSG